MLSESVNGRSVEYNPPFNASDRFSFYFKAGDCKEAKPLFFLPIHQGGFEGEWDVYCCTCKERAASGHGKAGV